MMKVDDFQTLSTPTLLLNKDTLERNCEQMRERINSFGLSLRPHMKTAKSIDVYNIAAASECIGITVSTLVEADYFSRHGVNDILYAVGIVPAKISQVAAIQAQGCQLKLITDNRLVIPHLNQAAIEQNLQLNLLIEIDSGGARGGLSADSAELILLAKAIQQASNIQFSGVMTHAGHSYHCQSIAEIKHIAQQERCAVLLAASRLDSKLNLDCEIISTGSTPTAKHADSFQGLSETRPGVYMFGDIDQHFLGSCAIEDIAVSVLTSVIGHNEQAGRMLIDAGGLALSKDISASEFSNITGYGWVCDESGQLIDHLYVDSVHQEHGLIANRKHSVVDFQKYPIGTRLRILPIHACMTVAAYESYQVHNDQNSLIGVWGRVNRW